MSEKWYRTEEEWYEAQTPEVQASYDAWIQEQADEMAQPYVPNYDTRHLEGR